MVGARRRARLLVVALLCLAWAYPVHGQDGDPYRDESRSSTTRVGMQILGGWALANIAVSTPLMFATEDETRRFHEGNVAWNLVNLGIAGAGFLGSRRAAASEDLEDALAAQRGIESALLVNIGLDMAYIAAGWALLERSERDDVSQTDRWAGYGAALILQGGFLLLFDIGFYAFQRRNRPDVRGFRR